MKKFILSLLFMTFIQFSVVMASNYGLPNKYIVENETLILNGTGMRHKWVDLYTAGLYLKSKSENAEQVINSNETMTIKINVVSKLITSSRLEEAMRSEISRVTDNKIEPYKDRIEQLIGAFKGEIKKGDVFDLIYTPDKGLSIFKNKEFKTTVKGLDFKKVIFMTWLGNDPADQDLKDGMMGK